MKENYNPDNTYGKSQDNVTSPFYTKNPLDIKYKLLNFLNEYDIFDVDFITYDDVEEDLATPLARKELIDYLFLVRQAEDGNHEFTNIIDEIINDIESFNDLERN